MTGRPSTNPTLDHYRAHAAQYTALLADHDSADARNRFLALLDRPGADILDMGCGAGRDLTGFREAGCRPVGVDGVAPTLAGLIIHELDLAAPGPVPWQDGAFDGAWAHHLCFHLPTPTLPPLLSRLHGWLRPGGLFYACDPTGDGMEGMAPDGRYLAFRRPQSWKAMVRAASFTLVDEWRRPAGLPRRQQGWLATVWRA